MLYVSGCIGINRERGGMVEGGVLPQARQVMENMKAVVEAGGCSMNNVVKCTVLLVDMEDFAQINAVYAEYFPENKPARACFAVKALPAGALIEIDCICLAPQ